MSLTSHRIHSIFVLRLFNDPIAMLFLYASLILFLKKHWSIGCILFSLGVSIKMNVLLFAPGLFIVLCLSHGFFLTLKYIFICGLVQVILKREKRKILISKFNFIADCWCTIFINLSNCLYT